MKTSATLLPTGEFDLHTPLPSDAKYENNIILRAVTHDIQVHATNYSSERSSMCRHCFRATVRERRMSWTSTVSCQYKRRISYVQGGDFKVSISYYYYFICFILIVPQLGCYHPEEAQILSTMHSRVSIMSAYRLRPFSGTLPNPTEYIMTLCPLYGVLRSGR
jgi:hypothetical protein